MRKFIKKIKNSIFGKILKLMFNLIKWAVEIFIVILAIIIVTQRVTNNEKSFLGYRIFNVASGSMEPEYAVGDILISKEKDPSTIQIGENIVYVGTQADYKDRIITHSVVKIECNEKGEYLFHTKGIANTIEDPIVHQDQLYGVIVDNNVVLAFICKILTNKYGLYFFVIIPIILYAFVEFVKIQGKKVEQEREERRLEEEKKNKKEAKKSQRVEPKKQQDDVEQEDDSTDEQDEEDDDEDIEENENADADTDNNQETNQEDQSSNTDNADKKGKKSKKNKKTTKE